MNAALDGGVALLRLEKDGMDVRISNELGGSALGDRRLDRRLGVMLEDFSRSEAGSELVVTNAADWVA